MNNGPILGVQADVDRNEDDPNDTVDQSGKGDVPGKVVLMEWLQRHEGAHEGHKGHRTVETLH